MAIKNTITQDGQAQIVEIFQTIVTLLLIVTLFFIVYFIIKIILKSRNTYFATLRMLGGTKKVLKQLIIIELLLIENLAYIICIGIIVLQAKNIINYEFIQTILKYLEVKDYIVLYVVLILMSYIISLKYSRKLFKKSTINTYNEEV